MVVFGSFLRRVRAISRFPAGQEYARSFLIAIRDGFASKMTPAQIAKAEKLAREWKPK
jgi:hypothetical protein